MPINYIQPNISQDNMNKIILSIQQLQGKQQSFQLQIKIINNEITHHNTLHNQLHLFTKHKRKETDKNNILVTNRNKLIFNRNQVFQKIINRARLRNIEPNLTNNQTNQLNASIQLLDKQIDTNQTNIDSIQDKINIGNDVFFLDKKTGEINTLNTKINNIQKQINNLLTDKTEMDSIILEEKMLTHYVDYAVENDIDFDQTDDFDLYRQCNQHHHNILLSTFVYYTNCSDATCNNMIELNT